MMRPVDPNVINMLHKILWPAPVASALWQYAKAVTVQGCRKIMSRDGSSGQPGQPHGGVIMARNADERRRQIELALRRQIPGGSAAGTGSGNGSSAADKSRDGLPPVDPAATSGGEQSADPDVETSRKAKPAQPGPSRPPPTVIDLARAPSSIVRGMFPTAWDQLVFNLRNVWRRQVQLPPNGCVVAFGTVNVKTTKGEAIFQVDGFYNLRTGKVDLPSLSVYLKALLGSDPQSARL